MLVGFVARIEGRNLIQGRALTLLLIVFAALSNLSACGLRNDNDEASALSEDAAGSRHEIEVGETLRIALEGNPTTGYEWSTDYVDMTVLRPLGEPTFKPSSGAIGSGGTVTLEYEAVAAGETPLRLIYNAPWLAGEPPNNTFELTVIVRDSGS